MDIQHMSYIILNCVNEKGKLRVKFHSYVDEEGKRYQHVYNNNLNCRFPKDIRQEGRYYRISPSDLKITLRENSAPFYSVKGKNVKIVNVLETIQIYKVEECICCMSEIPNITLVPCGHHCMCRTCYERMRHTPSGNRGCPVCRLPIEQAYINTTV